MVITYLNTPEIHADEELLYDSMPFKYLKVGGTYLFVFKPKSEHTDDWTSYRHGCYMLAAKAFEGATAYMVASLYAGAEGWATIGEDSIELYPADGWRAFRRI